jgi:WD40 repeat protein
VGCIAFTSDGTLLACGTADGLVQTWDPAAGRPTGAGALRAHDAAIVSMDFMPRTRVLVTGGSDKAVRLLDLRKSNRQIVRATSQPVAAAAMLKPAAQPANSVGGGDDDGVRPRRASGAGPNP